MSESIADQLRRQHDHCVHYTGLCSDSQGNRLSLRSGSRGSCRVNIDYDSVCKQGKRMIVLPCFHPEQDNPPLDGVEPTCDKCQFPTKEELDKEVTETETEIAESMASVTIVRPAIFKHAKINEGSTPKQDIAGVITCPVCKTGKLHYSIASYNGHCHAQCTTPDCCNWME